MKFIKIITILILCFSGVAIAGEYPIHTLGFSEYGPVKIGMTEKKAIKVFKRKLSTSLIPGEKPEPCHYLYPDGKEYDLGFMVEDGVITRIDVRNKKISTSKGIRIGDSESKVRKAYGRKLTVEPHFYLGKAGSYLKIKMGKGFGYVFETKAGKVTTFRAGKFSSIEYVEGCL